MTSLPSKTEKKLGLVIDLDVCVGCHACVVNCKAWNTSKYGAPLADTSPYDGDPSGVWLNRIHSYETSESVHAAIVHFPKSCLHCDDAPCVTVCPTGASYKRVADGIVLVDESKCMGCGLCAWACPYGAREMDPLEGVMKKCTLCVDRIYNENIPQEDRQPACVRTCPAKARFFGDLSDQNSEVSMIVKERDGVDLMPEQDTKPVNQYLLPKKRYGDVELDDPDFNLASLANQRSGGLLSWIDDFLQK